MNAIEAKLRKIPFLEIMEIPYRMGHLKSDVVNHIYNSGVKSVSKRYTLLKVDHIEVLVLADDGVYSCNAKIDQDKVIFSQFKKHKP